MLTQISTWTILDVTTCFYLYTRVSQQQHYNILGFTILYFQGTVLVFQEIFSIITGLCLPDATITLCSSRNNQKCLQTLPDIPWGGKTTRSSLHKGGTVSYNSRTHISIKSFGFSNANSKPLFWAFDAMPFLFSIKAFQNLFVGDSRSLLIFLTFLDFKTIFNWVLNSE